MFEKAQSPDQNIQLRRQQKSDSEKKKDKTKINPEIFKASMDIDFHANNVADSSNITQAKLQGQNNLENNTQTDVSSTGLPQDVQTNMENSFGTSFGDVSIHTNDKSASDLGALAYTQGKDVHFAPGQYNPQSKKGQELLGHELTHVIQQKQGRVKSPSAGDMQPTVVRKSDKKRKKEEWHRDYSISRTGGEINQMKFQLKYGKEQLAGDYSQKHFNNYVNGEVKQFKKDKSAVHQMAFQSQCLSASAKKR